MSNQEPVEREELLQARERIQAQISILRSPVRSGSPELLSKLREMLREIDDALARTDSGDA